MMGKRWVINRIGLINFWYYDEEEFQFSQGRLLLRGANSSGKSVTMQSFIPLLLDGNKSPERLDPFGSRARKIEDYLLGEGDRGENERTGYLFMEFKRENLQQYMTLGLGLRARRGRPLTFWGFAITDGRRVGKDFNLYKQLEAKIPLTKAELKNRLGEGGEIYDRQKDYMDMVNRLLFGYEQLEEYDELIKLLIQIRTPKLSKDFKPSVIYEILTNSLQALSDEDLRPMSEAIENMDNIKDHLLQLKESKNAATKLKREYDRYNTFLLVEKAQEFLQSSSGLYLLKKEEMDLQKQIDDLEMMRKEAEEELERLSAEYTAEQAKHRELLRHETYRLKEDLTEKQKNLAQWKTERSQKESTLAENKKKEILLRAKINKMADELWKLEAEIDEIRNNMACRAEQLHFDEHFFMEKDLAKEFKVLYDWTLLNKGWQSYLALVREALEKIRIEQEEQKRYDRAYSELERAKSLQDEARKILEESEDLFSAGKEELIEQIYAWRQKNTLLKPDDETIREIHGLVRQYPQVSYDDILMPLRQCHDSLKSKVENELLSLQARLESYQAKKEETVRELKGWLAQKDPEPERTEAVICNRRRLTEEGIPFIPFYKAVDFKKDVPEELKGKIEEALKKVGVLDALIVPENYKDRLWEMDEMAEDAYLFPQIHLFSQDLSDWLKPLDNLGGLLNAGLVKSIICSIKTQDDKSFLFLQDSGRYGTGGILAGQVASGYSAKYLGIESRRRYRREVIADLQALIDDYKQEIDILQKTIKKQRGLIIALKEEFNAFPDKQDLETASLLVREAQLTLENRMKVLNERKELLVIQNQQWKEAREEVRRVAVKLPIDSSVIALKEAEKNLIEYGNATQELATKHSTFVAYTELFSSLQDQTEDLLDLLEKLRYDLGRVEHRIKKEEQIINSLQEVLAQMDFEDIEKQVNECIQRMNELPLLRDRASNNQGTYRAKKEETEKQLLALQNKLHFHCLLDEIKRKVFAAEYELAYVETMACDGDTIAIATRIREESGDLLSTGKSKDEYQRQLQETYYEIRPQLAEYNLNLSYIDIAKNEEEFLQKQGQGSAGAEDEFTELEKIELTKARNNFRRIEIKACIQGRDVDFFTLTEFLTKSISENENLLLESDQQLFEDILVNTISKKIRARIYHSEQWVKKMNHLMANMNISSGLTFKLDWQSKAPESEEQIDTAELVVLLKSDANLLRPEDSKKLSNHFRSKISQARNVLEETGVAKSFHTIIKEVLDYRQWFEFKLFYAKTGERRREFTDNAFHRFSGGEKAMAMYVPLFSAVYAKYEGARTDSPRLISLDEAFAGVDENNIRDMFKLLEELGLNYIINSQILWGDYDTVPSLSICELVRPNNANYVSVIRYRWDGKIRSLINREAVG